MKVWPVQCAKMAFAGPWVEQRLTGAGCLKPHRASDQTQARAEPHHAVAQLGDKCLLLADRSRHDKTSIGTTLVVENTKSAA